MNEIEIIIPPRANMTKALDHALVSLTEAIAQINSDAVGCGALGGQYGYGADWKNDVFEMQIDRELDCICDELDPHYGWDHRADCPYSIPNFHHKTSGLKVWWYKWIGRGMEVQDVEKYDLQAIFNECVASLKA